MSRTRRGAFLCLCGGFLRPFRACASVFRAFAVSVVAFCGGIAGLCVGVPGVINGAPTLRVVCPFGSGVRAVVRVGVPGVISGAPTLRVVCPFGSGGYSEFPVSRIGFPVSRPVRSVGGLVFPVRRRGCAGGRVSGRGLLSRDACGGGKKQAGRPASRPGRPAMESGVERVYFSTPSSLPTLMNASMQRSSCSRLWPAEIWTRIRASPFGTTG